MLILVQFHLKLEYSKIWNTHDFFKTFRHLRANVTFFMDKPQWLERCLGNNYNGYSLSPLARKTAIKLLSPLLLQASASLVFHGWAVRGRTEKSDTPFQGNTAFFFPVPCSSCCPRLSMRHETLWLLFLMTWKLCSLLSMYGLLGSHFRPCGIMERGAWHFARQIWVQALLPLLTNYACGQATHPSSGKWIWKYKLSFNVFVNK